MIDTIRQLGNMPDDNIDSIVIETLKAIDLIKNKKERDYELTMRYRI